MTTKLILIEGIPGSGKTTFAEKIKGWYQAKGTSVNLYLEGQLHPADLGWCSCVPLDAYNQILNRYSSLEEDIKQNTVFENGIAIIAYTKVPTSNREFYKELEAYEVYDGRVDDEMFFKLHYDRWQRFGNIMKDRDELTIFECAYMQNHVNELLLWRNVGEDKIIEHHMKLLDSVISLSPILIYLSQPNIEETILRIAKERLSNYGNWIDLCISYCERSPYGQKHNLEGLEGAMEVFTKRKQIEMKIMELLTIPKIIVENANNDWNGIWNEIETFLLSLDQEI